MLVTDVRRTLLTDGTAVLGRATVVEDGLVWLKLTLLNPDVTAAQLASVLGLVESAVAESPFSRRELDRARAA